MKIILILGEIADLVGQVITVEHGVITLHFDRSTFANIAMQLKDAMLGN